MGLRDSGDSGLWDCEKCTNTDVPRSTSLLVRFTFYSAKSFKSAKSYKTEALLTERLSSEFSFLKGLVLVRIKHFIPSKKLNSGAHNIPRPPFLLFGRWNKPTVQYLFRKGLSRRPPMGLPLKGRERGMLSGRPAAAAVQDCFLDLVGLRWILSDKVDYLLNLIHIFLLESYLTGVESCKPKIFWLIY